MIKPSSIIAIALYLWIGIGVPALSQGYPTKAIRIYVGFAAGGATDVSARLLGQKLNSILSQPVIVGGFKFEVQF